MEEDDYEAINLFFLSVTKRSAPALSGYYDFALGDMWQQLSDEFPGAVDLGGRSWDFRNNHGYDFWIDGGKTYYEWCEELGWKTLGRREQELRESLIPDFWSVADLGWSVGVLNDYFQNKMSRIQDEKIVSKKDWLSVIRGQETISVTQGANSRSPIYIISNGDIFLVVRHREVLVFTLEQMLKRMDFFMKSDRLAFATFTNVILNWPSVSPLNLLIS